MDHSYSLTVDQSAADDARHRYKTHICCVPQCMNYREEGYSFHKFPNCKVLRKQWKIALKMGKPASSHMRVCSEHFKITDYFPGSANNANKHLKKNTIPTRNLPIRSHDKLSASDQETKSKRCKRALQRIAVSASSSLQVNPVNRSTKGTNESPNNCSPSKENQEKTCMDAATQTYICPIHLIIIDEITLYTYTGLQSFDLLYSIVKCITDIEKEYIKKHLTLQEHVLLAFVKIKLNLSYRAMGPLFGISRQAVSKYFKLMIKKLALVMSSVIPWPDQNDIRSNLPVHFRNYKNTRIVVDCAETSVEQSSCLKCRILTYSNYKKGHTVKFMLGVAPSGLITTVSKCYGGRASDKLITMESHILDRLEYQDAIMVDKGFFIQKECLEFQHHDCSSYCDWNMWGTKLDEVLTVDNIVSNSYPCTFKENILRKPASSVKTRNLTLHQPPFLAKKEQLTREEAIRNADIARARVHVERVIQRVRQFELISSKVEWTLLPVFEDALIIACGITNLSSPVINIDKFM